MFIWIQFNLIYRLLYFFSKALSFFPHGQPSKGGEGENRNRRGTHIICANILYVVYYPGIIDLKLKMLGSQYVAMESALLYRDAKSGRERGKKNWGTETKHYVTE